LGASKEFAPLIGGKMKGYYMKTNSLKGRLVRSTLLAGFAAVAASSGVAFAQEENAERIIVTGSLIPRDSNIDAISPITEVSSEEIGLRGITRIEDIINTLPQAFAGQGANISNGATGTSTVNLRGLGSDRTLVLVNGKRLPYGSPGATAADLNDIPSALVERVDVLTGGASSAYGSDAIAGVVNFKMIDDFQGIRLDGSYSFYQHKNDNDTIQALLSSNAANNPSQFILPEENVIDGNTVRVTGIMGVGTDDGRGNITAYASYRSVEAVLQADRDYSACAFGAAGANFSCSGSPTNQIANFLNLGGDSSAPLWFRTDLSSGEFINRDFTSDTFNFNPTNFYQRPDETYQLGVFGRYEINRHFEGYTELSFKDYQSDAQIAESGVFGGGIAGPNGGINCNNAFLSAQQVSFLCGPTGLSADGDGIADDVLILRRNVEGGPRSEDIGLQSFRGVIGSRGDFFNTPLTYDFSAQYAKSSATQVYNNEVSVSRASRALNAVFDGAGNIVCAVNADANSANDDPDCVPYDVFSPAGPSQAAVDYIGLSLLQTGDTTLQVLNFTVAGDLEGLGWKSPAASSPIGFAAGVEYRRNTLSLEPDASYQAAPSSDAFGQGAQTLPVSGATQVVDFFGELDIPLIEDAPFAKEIGLELAYRRSETESNGSNAYKVAGDWAPNSNFRARAGFQRSVRSPNVIELFSPNRVVLFDLTQGANGLYDPCAGDFDTTTATPEPTATAAQCANTGVTAAQYGNIADNPAGQFNQFIGGNPDLAPEESDTITLGFVATPSFVPGLNISVDYFDIKVDQFVGTVSPNQSLQQCLNTGDPFFCSLINRGNGGTLWANTTGFVTATNVNTGQLKTSGVDVLAAYETNFNEAIPGDLRFELVATWLEELFTKPLPSSTAAESYDCVGLYGSSCGTPNPELRAKLNVTWATPYDVDVSATWRHFSEVEIAQTSGQPALGTAFAEVNRVLDAQNYFDLSGNYRWNDVTLRAGVNNVLDAEPPLSSAVGAGFGNGNTFPQVYDSLGRYFFFGATVDF
jgi:iron complex outermembrane recepter protein